MSLRFDELPVGAVIPWRGVRWLLVSASAEKGTLTIKDPNTGKRRRLAYGSPLWGIFGRDMEALHLLTRPHCYGQERPCGWCRIGFDPPTHDGGSITGMRWYDD